MKCGVICTEDTTVEVCVYFVFLFYRSRVCILHDAYGQHVRSRMQELSNVCSSTHESPFHAVYLAAVKVNVGLPIYAIEVKKQSFTYHLLRQFECITIPKVCIKERF